MREFHGELLIGGMRLKDVRGELEAETPSEESSDCLLRGQLHLPPEQVEQLQLNREYRIQLDDGRGGQVVLSRIVPERDDEVLADFVPPERAAKSRAK